METFNKLKFTTAFCCMAVDGNIDKSEIALLKSMCGESQEVLEGEFETDVNILIKELNDKGKDFFTYYFDMLKHSQLTEKEEILLIECALNIIRADEKIDYSEIKFFKVIRRHLQISDEKILSIYPDIEFFLDEDINTGTSFVTMTERFLDTTNLPKFELIQSFNEF